MLITLVIIIVLLATTPRAEMHAAKYVFGSDGLVNQTGGWNNGLAFLFGLLSVQWTVRPKNLSTRRERQGYDLTLLDDCQRIICHVFA